MKQFNKLSPALAYALQHLNDPKRSFLINVQTSDNLSSNNACSIQFVDQSIVGDDGMCGLAMYLAFDKTVGDGAELAAFKQLSESSQFVDLSDDQDIECYAIAFGSNITRAVKLATLVLVCVYGFTVDDSIVCTFHDQ